MSVDEYDPSTALTAYFQDRNTRRAARLWSVEKLLHDLAEVGFVTFFEGAGDNPTQIAGYAIGKLWLRTSPLVTTEPGEFRAYAGSGDASLLSSWPVLDAAGVRRHLSIYSKAEVDAIFADGLPASFSSNVVTNASGVTGATVTAALNTVSASLATLTAADATLTSGVANATFPPGTVLIFGQTAAPTGWTKLTDQNNAALRVVSGTAGTGGTADFTTAFAARTIAAVNLPDHTITITDPGHSHSVTSGSTVIIDGNGTVPGSSFARNSAGPPIVSNAFTGITASFGTAARGGAQSAMDFAVKYVDVIRASKN